MNEKTPDIFIETYNGNDYTVEELKEGIQWLIDELNTRDDTYAYLMIDSWT